MSLPADVDPGTYDPRVVETCARAAHEANRAWCIAHEDATQKPWDEADEWQRVSACKGVVVALDGATPRDQHEAWCAEKVADGWVYGAIKDSAAKTHPCLVPYDALSPMQKAKDSIFVSVVRAVAAAFGWPARL